MSGEAEAFLDDVPERGEPFKEPVSSFPAPSRDVVTIRVQKVESESGLEMLEARAYFHGRIISRSGSMELEGALAAACAEATAKWAKGDLGLELER